MLSLITLMCLMYVGLEWRIIERPMVVAYTRQRYGDLYSREVNVLQIDGYPVIITNVDIAADNTCLCAYFAHLGSPNAARCRKKDE